MDKCPLCGRDFRIGFDGTEDGCDSCQGIERDSIGHLWLPTDFVHIYKDVYTGETIMVTREEAFKNG